MQEWYAQQLSGEEIEAFIAEAKTGKGNKKAFAGKVVPEAAERIKAVCGIPVAKLMMDSGAVRHAYKKTEHHLRDDDLLLMPEVVNTATDIFLSPTQHQNNICIEMNKDKRGILTFVFEARAHYGGWLTLVTAYRH
jgi:hypothetical protein